MGLAAGAGLVPGWDDQLRSWASRQYNKLGSRFLAKQSQDIEDGHTNLHLTESLHCHQFHGSATVDGKPRESSLSPPPSPELAHGHEEPPPIEQSLSTATKDESDVIGESADGGLARVQICQASATCHSLTVVGAFGPLIILFALIVLFITFQYVDPHLLPSCDGIITLRTTHLALFQQYWLLLIFLDHHKGCRRRRWIAACSIVWIDDTFWRTLSGTLFACAFPVLQSARLWALITLPNLAVCCPEDQLVETDGPEHTSGDNSLKRAGSPPNDSRTPAKKRGGRNSRAIGPGGGGSGGGASGDNNELPENRGNAAPDNLFACHYLKRWPFEHLACLHQPQTAPRYVKIHLKRRHMQPIHCAVCYQSFDSDTDLRAHTIARGCQQSQTPCPFTADISNDQRDALDRLSNERGRGDEVEKWYRMWDILFPEVPRPDSPFISGEDTQYLLGVVREGVMPRITSDFSRDGVLNNTQIEYVLATVGNAFSTFMQSIPSSHPPAPQPPQHHLHQQQEQHLPQPDHHSQLRPDEVINGNRTGSQDSSQQDISQQDLSQQDLSQQDLSQQDLSQQDLSQQDLSQQDLSQQHPTHAFQLPFHTHNSFPPPNPSQNILSSTRQTVLQPAPPIMRNNSRPNIRRPIGTMRGSQRMHNAAPAISRSTSQNRMHYHAGMDGPRGLTSFGGFPNAPAIPPATAGMPQQQPFQNAPTGYPLQHPHHFMFNSNLNTTHDPYIENSINIHRNPNSDNGMAMRGQYNIRRHSAHRGASRQARQRMRPVSGQTMAHGTGQVHRQTPSVSTRMSSLSTGRTRSGSESFQFLDPSSLESLHSTGSSALLSPAGSSPGPYGDQHHGGFSPVQNDFSDVSQVGSPSDLFNMEMEILDYPTGSGGEPGFHDT